MQECQKATDHLIDLIIKLLLEASRQKKILRLPLVQFFMNSSIPYKRKRVLLMEAIWLRPEIDQNPVRNFSRSAIHRIGWLFHLGTIKWLRLKKKQELIRNPKWRPSKGLILRLI